MWAASDSKWKPGMMSEQRWVKAIFGGVETKRGGGGDGCGREGEKTVQKC